jgi:hypothetical protein
MAGCYRKQVQRIAQRAVHAVHDCQSDTACFNFDEELAAAGIRQREGFPTRGVPPAVQPVALDLHVASSTPDSSEN